MSTLSSVPFSYESERLFYRPYSYEKDFENSLSVYGDERITKFFDHGEPRKRDEVNSLVQKIGIEQFKKNPTTGLFSIFAKEDQRFIGHFDFIPTEKPGEVEIGYIIRYEEQNKGFGTEIALNIIQTYGQIVYAHQLMHKTDRFSGEFLNRFYTTMHPENIGSIRLSEKMGMQKIGEKRRFNGSPRYEYAVDIEYGLVEKINKVRDKAMKHLPIGIIGGAGPEAGISLMDRVVKICQKKYHCSRDYEFPKMTLLSYPFTEMLIEPIDRKSVTNELSNCVLKLREDGAKALAIACNTLHAFLDESIRGEDLIELPEVLTEKVNSLESEPLVLCTTTSASSKVHKKHFNCNYPQADIQKEVDEVIDSLLEDETQNSSYEKLLNIIQNAEEKYIILGCTELSLLTSQLVNSSIVKKGEKEIIDPLNLVASKLLDKTMNQGIQN